MEFDTHSAENFCKLRHDLRCRVKMELMQPYVPGAMWSRILGGDVQLLTNHSAVRDITIVAFRLEMVLDENRYEIERYAELIAMLQEHLYAVQGALKHVTASHNGCSVVAALGLPPFEHNVVACTQGAVRVLMEFRKATAEMGMRTYGCVHTGRCWVGATGNESRHEYVIIGEPMQLASQATAR